MVNLKFVAGISEGLSGVDIKPKHHSWLWRLEQQQLRHI